MGLTPINAKETGTEKKLIQTEITYSIVNSFTVPDASGRQVGGNAAAVIFMQSRDEFSDERQLEIAKKFPALTEAVFVFPGSSEKSDIGMRYWSPQRFCEYKITGHPTIAAAFAMLQQAHPSLSPGKNEYRLETKAGIVQLRFNRLTNKVYMGQILPQFQDLPDDVQAEMYEIFGLASGDIVSPIKAVNMGLGYFIFQVKDLDVLMGMQRDLEKLTAANKQFGLNGGAQPFAVTSDPRYDVRTRNLDLRPPNPQGVWFEDSACGQGSASIMAYLMKYLGHQGNPVRMEQGVLTEPCCVESSGEWREGEPVIFIGGSAVQIDEGTLKI